jgi:glycosyltransferase involved in cell wall biosynthesis
MRRVMHCIPTLGQGGAERVLVGLTAHARDCEHVIVTIFQGADDFAVPPHVKRLRMDVPRSLWGALALPLSLARFLAFVRREKPSVVVGWLYYGALVASTARLLKTPVMWSIHAAAFDVNTAFRGATRIAIRACAWISARAPVRIQYCTDNGRVTHERLGFDARKSLVIENGIDLALFEPSKTDTARVRGGHVIVCLARFAPQKDHANLFAALALAKQRGFEFRLLLAGDGCDPTNSTITALIAAAGLQPDVQLLGIVADTPNILARSDVLVLSSAHGESMPLVILEAMAAKVIVVTTDVGFSREMVGDFGFVVPPRDALALADAIEQACSLSSAERDSLKTSALRRVGEKYSITTAARSWSAVFASV